MDLRPAATLREVFRVLHPEEPLESRSDLEAYYVDLDAVRGGGLVRRFELQLTEAFDAGLFRAFVYGHSGSGKSTEFARLATDPEVSQQYVAVRFSARNDMDPNRLGPLDVLVTMLIQLREHAAERNLSLSESLSERVYEWMTREIRTESVTKGIEASVSAGAGGGADFWWGKLTGLFAKTQGEMKFASVQKVDRVDEQVRRQSELVDVVNSVLEEAEKRLRGAENKRWLFIGEDFEKLNNPRLAETLFVEYASLFASVRANMILTIPVPLAHSSQRTGLRFDAYPLYDVPVYDRDHRPDETSRELLRNLLFRRVSKDLFEEDAADRLIIASGGHLRDLFFGVREAAMNALLRKPPRERIDGEAAERAIGKMRREAVLRLGEHEGDQGVTFEQKKELLTRIYENDAAAKAPSLALYSLLRSRAVHEYNGDGRFGVPPLIVDYLRELKALDSRAPGGSRSV